MNNEILMLIIIAAFFFWAWQDDKRRAERQAKRSEEHEIERLSDQAVAKERATFENELENFIDLPDAICWKRAYIYWNLMSEWFDRILARNYGNEVICNQIKRNYLIYIDLLRSIETTRFLALETKDETKRTKYDAECTAYRDEIDLIESALANAIGKEASDQLASVRLRDSMAFDRTGRKPMAPVGFRYAIKSSRPYTEELVSDK